MHFQLPFNPAKKRKLDEDEVQRFYEPYTLDKLNGNIPIILHPNDTVKMNDGSLMTIHHFEQELQMVDDELNITIFVVGRKFLRFKDRDDLGGFLKKSPQEVFQLASSKRLPFGRDRPRHPVHSVCRKVNLIKTNLSHKDFQSPDPGTFICRYICDKNSIVRLSAQEADEGRTRVDDTRRRNMFVHRRANPPPADPRKRYTFGDAFCGVGGMSAGARKAGLEVRWGFDFDYETCVTYAENFHCSTVFNGSVNQYLSLAEQSHVDVMHISPPCQTFSRAHTIPGKNDDDNTAALFSVTQLLLKARPRICTIEEVPGFIQMEENRYAHLSFQSNRRFYFQSFLRQILDAEYSVKWKILRAEEYGVPQCRERLIFLLAWYCPPSYLSSQYPAQANNSPTFPHQVTVQVGGSHMLPSDSPFRVLRTRTLSTDRVLKTYFQKTQSSWI